LSGRTKVKMPWGRMALAAVTPHGLWLSNLKRRTAFADAFVHEVVVPRGPDGRPGERLLAPSRSIYPPTMARDDSRCDFRVVIGERGSTFAAVCLGTVADRGDPYATSVSVKDKWEFPCSAVVEDEVAGLPAYRYRLSINEKSLTEWKFAREGWLYVVGMLCTRGDDELDMAGRSRRVLDSWRWID
jgi:hypothetical protein